MVTPLHSLSSVQLTDLHTPDVCEDSFTQIRHESAKQAVWDTHGSPSFPLALLRGAEQFVESVVFPGAGGGVIGSVDFTGAGGGEGGGVVGSGSCSGLIDSGVILGVILHWSLSS